MNLKEAIETELVLSRGCLVIGECDLMKCGYEMQKGDFHRAMEILCEKGITFTVGPPKGASIHYSDCMDCHRPLRPRIFVDLGAE